MTGVTDCPFCGFDDPAVTVYRDASIQALPVLHQPQLLKRHPEPDHQHVRLGGVDLLDNDLVLWTPERAVEVAMVGAGYAQVGRSLFEPGDGLLCDTGPGSEKE